MQAGAFEIKRSFTAFHKAYEDQKKVTGRLRHLYGALAETYNIQTWADKAKITMEDVSLSMWCEKDPLVLSCLTKSSASADIVKIKKRSEIGKAWLKLVADNCNDIQDIKDTQIDVVKLLGLEGPFNVAINQRGDKLLVYVVPIGVGYEFDLPKEIKEHVREIPYPEFISMVAGEGGRRR